MASLVADYGSDSESSSNSESSDADVKKLGSTALPKPHFGTDSLESHSVFVNPFAAADKANTAILEKHVKMISTDAKTVNGRKICWNYRKNKCRFGHNCKYAHDSDVQIDLSKNNSESNLQDGKYLQTENDFNKQEMHTTKSKKRPAPNDDFVPCGKLTKTINPCKSRNKTSQ